MAPTKQRFGALLLSKAGRVVTAVGTTTSSRYDEKENICARAHGADHSTAQPKASTLTAQQRSKAVRTNVAAACSLKHGISAHDMACMEPVEPPGGLACSAAAAAVQRQEPDLAHLDSHTPYTQLPATYISPTPEQLPPALRRRPYPPEQQSHSNTSGCSAAAQQVGIGPRETAQCCQSHRWQRITGPASPEGVLPPFMKRMLLLTKQHRAQQPAQQPHQHRSEPDHHQQQRQLRLQDTRKRDGAHLQDGAQEPQHKKRTTSDPSCAAVHRDGSSASHAGQARSDTVATVPAQAPASSAYDMVAETPQQATTTSPTAVIAAITEPSRAEAEADPAITRCLTLGVVVETPMALQPAIQQPQTVSISVVEPTPLTDAAVPATQQPATISAPSTESASWRGTSAGAGECWGGPPPSRAPSSNRFQQAIAPAGPSIEEPADGPVVELDPTSLPAAEAAAAAAAPTVSHAVLDLYSPPYCGTQYPNTGMAASAGATAGLYTARVAAVVGLPPARGPARANSSHVLRERWWELEQQQLLQKAVAGDLQRQQLAVDAIADVAVAAVAAAQCDLAATDPGRCDEEVPAALNPESEPSLLVEVCDGVGESAAAAADDAADNLAAAASRSTIAAAAPALDEKAIKHPTCLPVAGLSPVSSAAATIGSTVVDPPPSATVVDGVDAANKGSDSQPSTAQLLVQDTTDSTSSLQDSEFRCVAVDPGQTGAAGGTEHGRDVSARQTELYLHPAVPVAPAAEVDWHIEPTQSDIVATAGTLLPPTLQETYVSQSPLLATQPLLIQQSPAAASAVEAAAEAAQAAEAVADDGHLLQGSHGPVIAAHGERNPMPVSALLAVGSDSLAQDDSPSSPAAVQTAPDLTTGIQPASGSAGYSAAAVEEYSLVEYSPTAAGVTQDGSRSLGLLDCSLGTLEGVTAGNLPSTVDTEATAADLGQVDSTFEAAAAAGKALLDMSGVDADEAAANASQDAEQPGAAVAAGAVEAVADAAAVLQLAALEPRHRSRAMVNAAAEAAHQQLQQVTNSIPVAAGIRTVADSHTAAGAAAGAVTVGNVDPDLGIDLDLAFLLADQLESCLNRNEAGLGLVFCSHRQPKPQSAEQQQQQQEEVVQQQQEEHQVHGPGQQTVQQQQQQQQRSGQRQQQDQGLLEQEQQQQHHQQKVQQQQQQHDQEVIQQEQQQPQQQQLNSWQQPQGNEGLHDQEQQQHQQEEHQQKLQQQQQQDNWQQHQHDEELHEHVQQQQQQELQQQDQGPTPRTCNVLAGVTQLPNQQQQQCHHHLTSAAAAAAAVHSVVSPSALERVRTSSTIAAAAAAGAGGLMVVGSPCSPEASQHAEPPGTLSGRGVTQVTVAQSTPRTSQTQSELLLGPEVADLSFHDPVTSEAGQSCPLVCESFPFQKDAVAFSAWCNKAGPAAVAALQQLCRSRNFGSFHERRQFLQQYMRQREGPSNAAAPEDAAANPAAAAAGSGGGNSSGFKLPWVRVFTEEYAGRNGYTRRFLAASYQALWRRHMNTPTNRRHLYEVIQERSPCHLYFDIEYNMLANPTADGDKLVNQLLALVRDQLMRMDMQSDVTLTKGCILELDSSTSEKFSRHIVVRVPGYAFRDNQQVGAFIRALTTIRDDTEFLYLVKKPGTQERVCMVDGAVYTKNRHFRMLGSSKGGKPMLLQPTDRWAMSAAHNNDQPLQQHQLFLMSLICNVHPDSILLDFTPSVPAPLQLDQHRQQQQQRREGLGCGGSEMMYQYPARPDGGPVVRGIEAPAGLGRSYRSIKASWGPLGQQQPLLRQQQAVVRDDSGPQQVVLDPDVLQDVVLQSVWFVEDVATRRAQGAPAQVRTVAYCGQASACSRHCAFAFSLIGLGSHMCANVGRSHRNNHVFYVVDFANGVYCQKCHDPDCWGFRSPWNPLPQEVWQRARLMGDTAQ